MSTGSSYANRTRPPTGSIAWAVEGFLFDRKARGLSGRTIEFYRLKLSKFLSFLQAEGVERIKDLEIGHVNSYFMDARAQGRDNSSILPDARAIRTLLRWAYEEGSLVSERLILRLKMPRAPKKLIPTFSLQDLERLLQAASRSRSPERDTAILLLMADTGIRASELCAIRDSDLDGDLLLVHGKGRKERRVRISPKTRRAIWTYQARRESPDEEGVLFLNRFGEPFSRCALWHLFRRLSERASLDPAHPHQMRHTFATEALRSGMGMNDVRLILGHESLSMVQRYTEGLSSEDATRAHLAHSLVDKISKRKAR